MEASQTNLEGIQQDEEMSLKEVIIVLQEWIRYVLSKWFIILLCGLTGGGLGLAVSLLKKPKYVGSLTFVLEDSKNNALGAYAGLASQFGVDLGGGNASGVFSGENIIEFLKSRLMVEKTLLSPINIDRSQKSIADYYVEVYDLNKSWKNKPALAHLNFHSDINRKQFTLQQDSVLNEIYHLILKNNLNVSKPDKKLSFIAVNCVSINEIFSKVFTERLVKEATDFYVATKTKRSKLNVDKLQAKADSIVNLLNKKTYSAAVTQDLNLNPARRIATVGTELVTRDKVVLQTMYGEVVKNLEMSRMAMSQEAPLIQIVDTPILPLEKLRLGKVKGIIIGGIAGGFIALMILILGRIYKMIMK